MANLQKALDAEKATKEEAEKKASEEKLKNEHENAIFQAREEGCDESFFSAADEVNGLKNKIYRASYEFSLDNASISDGHELNS